VIGMFQNTEHIRTSLTQVNKQNRDIRKPSNPNLLCVLWFCIINLTFFFRCFGVFRILVDARPPVTANTLEIRGRCFFWLLGERNFPLLELLLPTNNIFSLPAN